MARKAGDVRPFSDEEQKEALRTTLKRVGRLICPACKKAYISLQGFKYHSQSCGSGAASGDGPVTCGVCKTFCHSEAQFRHHAMSQHNGLARPSGQSQIFTEEDEYSILRNTIRYLKKLYCLRPECGKAFISLGGYQYHVKQCGQESQYQDCPVCGKKLKMLSMRYHMKASHPPSPPPMSAAEQEAAAEQIIAASGQPKRKAAKRAREKVQEIARGIDVDDDVPSSREWRQETKDKDFPFTEFLTNDDAPYTKPTQVHISSSLFAEWRKEGETNGTIKCKNPGCTQEFALPWQMRTHYLACIHSQFDLMYTCRCGKKTRTEALMLTHQEYHLKDFHSDSEEDDKDYEFSSSKGGRKLSAAYRFSQTSGRKQIVWEPFPHAIEWTLQFRKKHYQDVIFPDWRPKSDWWKEASTSEQDIYWPATRQSVNFQTTTVPQPTHQLSSDWKQLNLFETAADQDLNSSTFFVGGPVWAMAWCPTPLGRKTAQHLAVSCHHNMDDKMVAENIQAGPGVIQIWKITDSTHPRSPLCCSLQLAICHDEGFIYQLEWCPSGCWEDETMHTEGKNMPSLGLLAASCSTGNINIFCVPHASSVKQSLKSCTFKVRPTVVLQTNPVLSSSLGPPTSPCLCLSWLRSKQHTFIAGGFADGRVALWDLQMRSPLLSLVTQEQQTLFGPFQIFQAHMCAVYDVNWAPAHHGQHLCTVGLDRQVHFWCTDDLGVPTNSVGRGRVIKLEWSPHWCGVFTSQDDCYHYTRNFMAFIDSGYQPNGSRSLTVHNGCIWDVSVNDWLNCAVSCDSSGEVVGNVLCHMMQNFHMKGIDKRRFPIYRIKLEELHVKNDDVLLEENSSIEIEVKPDILNMSNISNKDQVSPQTTECVSNSNEVQRTNTCVENLPQNKDSTQEASQDSIESDKPQKPVATTKKQKAKENEEKPFEILPTTYEDSAAKFGIVFCDAAILKGHVRPVPDSELIRLTVSTRMNRTLPHSFPLSSVNRVCWNPNLGSHLLVASGSHSGLVRIHRVTWLHHGADNRFKNMQDTSDSSEEDEEDETTSKEDATTSQTKAGDEAATSTTGCASDEFESVSSTLMDGNSVEDLLSESGVSRTECVEEEEEEEAQDISGTIENETEEPEATR